MKTIAYLTIAVVLGALAALAPLVTVAQILGVEQGNGVYGGSVSKWLREGLKQLDGSYDLNTSTSDTSGFTALTISFVIAIVIYLIVKRRLPIRQPPWVRLPPY